jgi:hypothetical protein
LQRHEGVNAAEQHGANGEKKQPRVMPVEKNNLGVDIASMVVTARAGKSVENGVPGECASIT